MAQAVVNPAKDAFELRQKYEVGGPSITSAVGYFQDNPGDLVGTLPGCVATGIGLAAQWAGKEELKESCDYASSKVFGRMGAYVKLAAAPLCAIDAVKEFSSGDALKGTKRVADFSYCASKWLKFDPETSGLPKQVLTWMGAIGGGLSPILGSVICIKDLQKPSKFTQDADPETGELGATVINLGREEENCKKTSSIWKLLKSIAQIALATLAIVGMIVGSFMSVTVSAIVISTVSLVAVGCGIMSHMYKSHADDCKEARSNAMADFGIDRRKQTVEDVQTIINNRPATA